MATHRRPPVIPEIAKAFTNDPRTQLALAAAKEGSSTTPVAQGKYAMADGVARMLQGLAGGYMQRKQMDAYGGDEAELLALRKARGVDGLTGVEPPAPMTSPAASQPPQQAQAVAAALGVPVPPSGAVAPPPGPPPIPSAPIPPLVAPVRGAGPGARRPFGPSAQGVNDPYKFTPEAVPEAPAPVVRPKAPDAIGPTKSRLLNAAYRIMADANPYESASGQDMYGEGLKDQTHLDESAAERQQHVADMSYQSDLSVYASGAEQDRGAKIAERAAAEARNATGLTKVGDRIFEHGENGLKLASAEKIAALERATQVRVAQINAAAKEATSSALTQEEQDAINRAAGLKRLDIMRVNSRNRKSLAQALIANPNMDAIQLSALAAGKISEGRQTGSRVGNTDVATAEVPVLAAAAKQLHTQLKMQGSLVPWNRAVQMVQNNTSSPELSRVMAINSAVTNAYARSFGTGQASVDARNKAEKQLQAAWGTAGYEAALDQIVSNTHMERQGAQNALDSIGGGDFGPNAGSTNAPLTEAEKQELLALKRKYNR